jgi:hypothetical protein
MQKQIAMISFHAKKNPGRKDAHRKALLLDG